MAKLDQRKTPYLDALKKYTKSGITPFDVPGHHMGGVSNKLKDYLGDTVYLSDVNAPYGLDNLSNPQGVLLEAEKLMSDFTGAKQSYFLINGTSSGIIAMIMAACKAHDKIILPRNVHKSIVSALVVSGASPVYIMPKLDSELEIANQPTVEEYIHAMNKYPTAKAIFVINPTYFGVVNDLKRLVEEAHSRGMAVLCDEAHGAHYYFDKTGPINAMEAGADISSVSFHKTGGSLTQSSVLLFNSEIINVASIRKTLNLINTTSPSTLLLASIDAARCYDAIHGQENMNRVHELVKYAHNEIKKIKGFIPCGKEYFMSKGCFDYDETKFVIKLDSLDISGFELYRILNTKYRIQIELAETNVILCIFAIGNNKTQVKNFIEALKDVSKHHYVKNHEKPTRSYGIDFPFQLLRPRAAYHAPAKKILIDEALNQVSRESIMIYPPGIPLIVPGEVFTQEIIDRVKEYKNSYGATILSDFPGAGYVNVIDIDNWKKYRPYKNKLEDYINKRLTNPRNDNYAMPFEGGKHHGTFILLPFRKDTWRKDAKPALKEFKNVIFAIAKYEKVYVGIHPRIYSKVIEQFEDHNNVIPVKIRYNDSWARDNSPIFVLNDNNEIRSVDFRFNAWGGSYDGLYSNYKDDDALTKVFSKYLGVERYYLDDFVLEGGSIHVDGERTCMVTEACLLSPGRNPEMTKAEIEERLKTYLNCSKVIWLPHGIYNDETNEHVDNIACFIEPGVVALAWTDDKTDPQYEFSNSALKVLRNSVDAQGRKIKVVKVKLPKPLYMSKQEAKGIKTSKYDAKSRPEGLRLSASYINFYQGEKFVILPAFGVPEDELAKAQMKKLYPNKDIIQIYSKEILLGGGNIHCITMQIPYSKELDKDED